jgi:hypothetical protein
LPQIPPKTGWPKKGEKSCFFLWGRWSRFVVVVISVEWLDLKQAIRDFKTILNQKIDLDNSFDELLKLLGNGMG